MQDLVLSTLLKTAADVDALVARFSRHRPSAEGDRVLQVVAYWWEPEASLTQKNLARAWSAILAKVAGCTAAEMWEALCGELLGYVEVVDPITRRTRTTYRSSTTIRGSAEWKTFLDGIQRIARENFAIPKLPSKNDAQAWAAFRGMKRVATEGDH